MKKLFCIILASLALISFAACSRGSGDRPSGATPTPAETMRDGTYTCRVNVTGGGELTFHDTAQVNIKNKEAVAHIVCTDRRVQYAVGENYGLTVQSRPGWTCVSVHLPNERRVSVNKEE